ncbi:acyl-CoA dehydrogenase [Megasphaera hominis]|jgi:butyryl-CoA dehydrogenase|uniref:Acyl-CoA dehydrogenase n=1 Tax=Megasphaera hominis TaxID=159836 RepID=A0ABR6VJU9_9FIRM|nr:acyl-CoA dehydrogenase [Megasphaera hominis]MBC3537461.1 acyl-CoA dehydrogenase [Megasphaera hominis]
MDFNLTDVHQEFINLAAGFGKKKLAPTITERDHQGIFDEDLVSEMLGLGLCGAYFEEKYGGAECDVLSYILAVEELAKYDAGMSITLSATVSLCANPIWQFGTEAQKEKYLTPLVEGKKLGAFGLTEPNAGTDASGQQTVAVKNEDGSYTLNGSKIFITNGGAADIYIVFAMTDKSQGSHNGISAFILEKDMPGFTFGKKEDKLGIHTSQTMELVFQDVKVPAENLLGQEGQGFKIAMKTLDGGRIGVAAQALGIAEAALQDAVEYSKQRVQFGKPLCKFQSISFKLADMKMKVEAARLLVYKAACKKQEDQPFSVDAAIAKRVASDVAMEIATEAVQIFGGYGYSEEYPVARHLRDAKITQIYEGTNEVQLMVTSSALLR